VTTPYSDPNLIHNPATGTSPPASWGDKIRDNLEFLVDPPRAKAMRTSDPQPIPTGTWTSVEFEDWDDWDTDGFHTPPDATFEIPAGLAGVYLCIAVAQLDNSPTGNRAIRFLVNASQVYGADAKEGASTTGAKTSLTAVEEIALDEGDTIELQIYHQRTVDLDLDYARMSIRYVARTD